MALRKNKTTKSPESTELGFGAVSAQQRLMNADGTYNYVREGLPWWSNFNVYHFLISCSNTAFFGSVILRASTMQLA